MSQQGSRNRARPSGQGSGPGGKGAGNGGGKGAGSPRARRTQAERRAAAEARMRAEQARERRRRIGYVVAGIAIVVLVGGGLTLLALNRNTSSKSSASGPQILPAAVTGAPTTQKPVNQVPDKSGIDGVLAWDTGDWPGAGTSTAEGTLEHQHVPGPVTYSVVPPVGGPHNEIWMNAGVYDKPIPAERAVHNMEHGAVWITYRPDLPASEVSALRTFVDHQSLIDESASTHVSGQKSRYVDLSPWSGSDLPSPIVISAWGHQLRVDKADDPRLQKFVDTFRNSKTYTPEFGEGVDGIPVQTGGRPVADGATGANPSGSVPAGSS